MYIYIYIYICVCIYIHTHSHTHVRNPEFWRKPWYWRVLMCLMCRVTNTPARTSGLELTMSDPNELPHDFREYHVANIIYGPQGLNQKWLMPMSCRRMVRECRVTNIRMRTSESQLNLANANELPHDASHGLLVHGLVFQGAAW